MNQKPFLLYKLLQQQSDNNTILFQMPPHASENSSSLYAVAYSNNAVPQQHSDEQEQTMAAGALTNESSQAHRAIIYVNDDDMTLMLYGDNNNNDNGGGNNNNVQYDAIYDIEAFRMASNIGLTCYFILAVLGTVLNLMVFIFLHNRTSRGMMRLQRQASLNYGSSTIVEDTTLPTQQQSITTKKRASSTRKRETTTQYMATPTTDVCEMSCTHQQQQPNTPPVVQPQQQTSGGSTLLDFHIMHLSLAELLVSCLNCGIEVGWRITEQWYAGDIACRVVLFIRPIPLYATSFIVSSIAIDRLLAVRFPFSGMQGAYRRAHVLMFGSWTLAVLCSLPQIFVFRLETRPGTDFHQCMARQDDPLKIIYAIYGLSVMYYIPTILVIVCYAGIFITLCRRSALHQQFTEGQQQQQQASVNIKDGSDNNYKLIERQTSLRTVLQSDPNLYALPKTTLLEADGERNSSSSSRRRASSNDIITLTPQHSSVYIYERGSQLITSRRSTRGGGATAAGLTTTLPTTLVYDRRLRIALRLSVAIVCAFIFCTLPYATVYSAHLIVDARTSLTWPPILTEVLLVFSASHVIINPLLYGNRAFNCCCFSFSSSGNNSSSSTAAGRSGGGGADNSNEEEETSTSSRLHPTNTASTCTPRQRNSNAMQCESCKQNRQHNNESLRTSTRFQQPAHVFRRERLFLLTRKDSAQLAATAATGVLAERYN